ncbi:hypothetical protein CVIRNUC_009039 [Coccomyxa viridis]|uniref:Uncharacterized protein n=1 Tax=Coccomyxa viridis TaxID=1274662 RepID=A0AAV1IGL1_9CHLO|nr:hypothetical protein CVIRNUC_009039 [Coccomyxa viridis]
MADTVLDDALADFDVQADRLEPAADQQDAPAPSTPMQQESHAASPAAASSHAPVLNGASSARNVNNLPSPKPFNPLPERRKPSKAAGKPGSFGPSAKGDDRRKPTGKSVPASQKQSIEAGVASSSISSSTQPPTRQPDSSDPASSAPVDKELAQGMAELMAALAKADGAGGAEQGPETGKHVPHEREMASTLAALAAAAPASGASGEPSGLENLGGPDGDAEGSFASLADTIMQQLLSKDVLYQPMKDIGSKYPTWLATHRESLPAGEVQRYEAQYRFIQQICALYEEEPNDFGKLFTLIQEMQACGQPPDEIVQDLAPGLAFGADGLPQLPTSATDKCTIS